MGQDAEGWRGQRELGRNVWDKMPRERMAGTKRTGSKRLGQDTEGWRGQREPGRNVLDRMLGRQDGEGKDDSGPGTILTRRYSSV